MPFELKLAWTYFRSARKGLVRFTSAVAMVGIAVGVASLIIAQALSDGFANEIQNKVLDNTAHILVTANSGTRISNWGIIKQKLEALEGVENVEPTHYESAVISALNGKNGYAVLRVGKWGKRVDKIGVGDSADEVISVSVGRRLAEKLGLKAGDGAEILTLQKKETPESSKVVIGELFETGLYDYDSTWINVSASDYLKLKGRDRLSPTLFAVDVKDIFQTEFTSQLIKNSLGNNFEVLDWREANKPLFSALSLERKVSFGIILLIVLVAALNITTTLALLINERKIDIAILRSCGAKTKSLMTIFLVEGIILSAVGVLTGVALGLLACYLGNYFRVVSISKEIYALNYIPFDYDFGRVLGTVLLAFLLCGLSMIYPVLSVSKIKPLELIRRG